MAILTKADTSKLFSFLESFGLDPRLVISFVLRADRESAIIIEVEQFCTPQQIDQATQSLMVERKKYTLMEIPDNEDMVDITTKDN